VALWGDTTLSACNLGGVTHGVRPGPLQAPHFSTYGTSPLHASLVHRANPKYIVNWGTDVVSNPVSCGA